MGDRTRKHYQDYNKLYRKMEVETKNANRLSNQEKRQITQEVLKEMKRLSQKDAPRISKKNETAWDQTISFFLKYIVEPGVKTLGEFVPDFIKTGVNIVGEFLSNLIFPKAKEEEKLLEEDFVVLGEDEVGERMKTIGEYVGPNDPWD